MSEASQRTKTAPPVGDAQSLPTQLDPSGSALLLAQSALGSAAAQASSSRMPGAVSSTAPALQGVPSVAAGPALRPGEAPGVPGTGAMAGTALAGSATVATSEAAAAAASAVASAVAVAPGTAASTQATAATVVGAVTGEPDVPAPVAGAARNPALRAATGPASDVAASVSSSASLANPAVASAPTAAQAASVDGLVAPSATAASAAASSAAAQQAQRAVAQAVADRAAQQAPVAGVASGRGATDLSATAALAGASAGGESSPLLRRFERVLSMTHAALGDAAAPGGGTAFAASAFTTPVDAAGASASVASGAADRSADAMNGWLAQVVAQKNQNASLTVEVGGRPVSVDVQVKGNEAQVVFRADQADTRALLAQAMPQLRQMMGAEGVVLADASVAGSWAGGTHAGAGGAGGSGGSSGDGTSGRGTA
ncbi:MAG: flagellar hook-length control protein FliK, partial [Variovorax sp.]